MAASATLLRFLLMRFAGWLRRQPAATIDDLKAEKRMLRARLGGPGIVFADAERRQPAEKARALGRGALHGPGTIVPPETLLRRRRALVAGRRHSRDSTERPLSIVEPPLSTGERMRVNDPQRKFANVPYRPSLRPQIRISEALSSRRLVPAAFALIFPRGRTVIKEPYVGQEADGIRETLTRAYRPFAFACWLAEYVCVLTWSPAAPGATQPRREMLHGVRVGRRVSLQYNRCAIWLAAAHTPHAMKAQR
jgi:hypothetical protein